MGRFFSAQDMYALQDFKSSPAETIKAALAAGTDVACSPGVELRRVISETGLPACRGLPVCPLKNPNSDLAVFLSFACGLGNSLGLCFLHVRLPLEKKCV